MKRNAILIFFLSILIAACSSNRDKELFDSAEKKNESKNYAEALKEYQSIIDEYPESEYAPKSLMKLGAMYQMYQVPNTSNPDAVKKAVDYYRQMYKQFPEYSETPKALFLSGFLLANEIKNYDEAKITYQTFLDKYPNNELIPQVKLEMENLGKSPEEILQSKLAGK